MWSCLDSAFARRPTVALCRTVRSPGGDFMVVLTCIVHWFMFCTFGTERLLNLDVYGIAFAACFGPAQYCKYVCLSWITS